MRRAIYPGTFDPLTLGHLDIVERARRTFDEVVVLLAVNTGKTPLFSLQQRLELVRASVAGLDGVRVDCHDGLLVEYAQRVQATAIVRGLRAISDFDYEFQMAIVNRKLAPQVETVFLMPSEEWSYLNSSIVRELWRFGGDYSRFVPEVVRSAMDQLKGSAS
ncbi:MAG: pantetheine-phosphate adenylyltransferase [Candidatus Delongbacteria bacterium]